MNQRILKGIYLTLGAVSVLGLVIFLLKRPGLEGDTIDVVNNSFQLRGCISQNIWTGCFVAGRYPLFQILPAVGLSYLGASKTFVTHFFAYVSAVAFLTILVSTYRLLHLKDVWLARFSSVIFLSGYDLAYINSSFGELFGAVLIFGGVVAILTRRHLFWILLLAFYAGLSKETAPPFVWLFLMIAWSIVDELNLKRALQTGLVLVCSIGCNVAFNYFRYGSPFNQAYLDPAGLVSLPVQLEQFFALWLSPRGGLLWFWPAYSLLIAICIATTRRKRWEEKLPLYGILTAFAALTFGFAKTNFCFGWISWGPRYFLPWIPVSIFLLLYCYANEIREGYLAWGSRAPKPFAWLAVAVSFLSLPQFRILLRHRWVEQILIQRLPPGASPNQVLQDLLWPKDAGFDWMLLPGEKPLEWFFCLFLCSLLFYSWMSCLPPRPSTLSRTTSQSD